MRNVLPIDGIEDPTNTAPVINTPQVVDTPEQIQYDTDLAALNKLTGSEKIKAKETFDLKYPKGRPGSTPVITDPNKTADTTDASIAAALAATTKLGIGEALLLDKTYGEQLQAVFTLYKTNPVAAADLLFKSKWAKLDTDARDRYLLKIENSDLYKERLNSWLIGVKKELAGRNLKVSDTALADYYLKGIDNATIIDEAISGLTSKSGDSAALTNLRITAEANGLDLDADFAKEQDSWLQAIARGEDPNKFYGLIRDKAGEGQNEFVKKLLKTNKDLKDIYQPFITQMASAFNIVDPNTIDINDPILKKVFTKDGAMNVTQFANLLRTDTRFSTTPTAISEGNVAAQARQQLARIAQDNGYNLDIDFKDQVDGWLARIRNGESVDLVGQAIRDKAGTGRTKYVQDLLKSGYDLKGIYGTYINLMAQTFGVDPESINENDPLLQKVFTDKGPLTISNFEALLRTDARFKGSKVEGQQKDFRQSIVDRALGLGVTLDDAAIDDIVSNALSMGISASSSLVDGLIRAKLSYTPGKTLGGAAGGALAQLKATAAANGLDFDTQFGTQAQTWLAKILQGESPDTFKNVIRQTAKLGLPEKVGSLLDLGVDLETIYSPYKNVMSSILEINPQTIGLDDKTLRSAIGPDKEMTLYDWQNSLRKDPRWQYTNNARQEVSDIGLNVLQQLGFQG